MRRDLAALSVEAVVALSNLGLAKRAQREIGAGAGPALDEDEAGLVTGRFPDGATVRWPEGVGLRDAACDCGASPTCRHRVAVALAYGEWARDAARASPDPTGAAEAETGDAEAASFDAWSPACFDDAGLARGLGTRVIEAARAARSRGVLARVSPASAASPTPSVALPACTVRFLAPRALSFARCDCEASTGCLHIALAVWAFREARDAKAERTVELSRDGEAVDQAALEPLRAIARWVLEVGIDAAGTSGAFPQRAALARHPLEEQGSVWMLTLLDDLGAAVSAYRERSATYRAASVFELVSEIEARARSALTPPSELPAGFVLGRGTPFETRLEHVRLNALGARVRYEGRAVRARVLFANAETGDVLGFDRTFEPPAPGAPIDLDTLGRRRLGGSTLAQLAAGQLVTRAAVRRANDALLLRTGVHGATSVTPQRGDLSSLPAARRVADLAALRARLAGRAPAFLRPRRLGEDVLAIEVESVGPVFYDSAEQTVFASLFTPDGDSMLLARAHEAAAPRAIDSIAAVLGGAHGAVRWVVGTVSTDAAGLRIDPTMIVADLPIVPDFEVAARPLEATRGRVVRAAPEARRALETITELLVEAAHAGLGALSPSFADRLRRAGDVAAAAGLRGIADRGAALAFALGGGVAERADRWLDAAIRARLLVERA